MISTKSSLKALFCATLLLCLSALAFSQACTNLCLQQTTCSGSATTSLSGYVFDPANNLPVANAIVYVPNGTVQPFIDGPSSGPQVSGSPLVSTTTDIAGHFTLTNTPVGSNIPLVVQAGLWRRKFTIPTINSCTANILPGGTAANSGNLTLPANHTQGDIPKIAIVTGGDSSLECVALKVGISQSEFTDPGGSGRINLYEGDGVGGAVVSNSSPAESALFSSQANLNAYDVVLFGSQGQTDPDATATNQQVLANFADAGGRVFAETSEYGWLDGNSAFAGTVNWNPGQGSWGNYLDDTTYPSIIDTAFTRGTELGQWLNQAIIYGGTLDQIPVGVIRHDFTSVGSGTHRWLYTANDVNVGGNGQGPGPNIPLQFTFDTPVGSSSQPGRVWFNDYLVDAQQNSFAYTGLTFPAECPTGGMTPQEKLFEYGLFDLTTSLGAPSATVAVTNSPATFVQGDSGDTVTINVSNMSATPLDTSLTLTAVLPTGLTAVSMAGQGGGTAWACNSSTLVCTRNAPLSVTANDPITLTVAVALNAPTGTGALTVSATAAGGGLASSVNGSEGVTSAAPANACIISGALYPTGTVNPANTCQVCVPATNTTSWSTQPNGSSCNDGNACTQVDTCQSGVCIGSFPMTCNALDTCHRAGTCNPSTGACSNPTVPDGTVCNDGNSCTQTDVCLGGSCTGSNPVTCTALDSCHNAGTCNPSTGACSNPPVENPACVPLFGNGGFETGTPGAAPPSWTVTSNINNSGFTPQTPQSFAGLNLSPGGTPLTVLEESAAGPLQQADPDLGTAASLRWPRYGNQAVSVNQQTSVTDTIVSQNVNSLSQTLTVGSADIDPSDNKLHLRFTFAPVFLHDVVAVNQAPYYFIQVNNITQNTVLYEDFVTDLQSGIPWQTVNSVNTNAPMDYTDWQLVDAAVGAPAVNVGDAIKLLIIAANNEPGAHFGRVWVDGVGNTINGISVEGSAPATVNPGGTLTYTLGYQNGSSSTETGVSVTFVTPPNTTFQGVSSSVPCVTPAVGAAGTVSCTVAALGAGGSGSLSITVNVGSAGSAGTLVMRNYGISSDQETTLLGPPISTAVGCTTDSACSAGNWCDESLKTCTPTLANNVPIPTDPQHSNPALTGVCTAGAAALVCTSGVCDSSGNKCGYSNGDGACNQTNASAVCDSGACSVSGVCEPLGGCEVNADCGSGTQCSASKVCITGLAVTAWPTASAIASGQTLASSVLTGGTATVSGTFSWTNPAIVPPAGTSSQSVTFSPTDTTDYTPVVGSVSIVSGSASNLVVTTAADDTGNAANCTLQATAGAGSDPACSLRDALLFAANAGSGKISFDGTAFSASNSVATNTITLKVDALNIPPNTTITFGNITLATTAGTASPLGNLDKAVDSSTSSTAVGQSDSLRVSGWAADPQDGVPLSHVTVYVDGVSIGAPTLGTARPDVVAAYGNSAYLNSGYQLLYPASSLALGTHHVTVVAIDSGGRSTTFGPRTITVATTAGTGPPLGNLDKAVDSSTSTTTVGQSDSLKVSGWVADPQDGAPLSNVTVYVDGVSIGAPTLGTGRPDVVAAYGNSAYLNSGYQLLYPASSLALGTHQVTVVAIDSGGRSTTFGPRTITVQ